MGLSRTEAQTAPRLLPQVVIVGGGFAGLSAARALRRAAVQVTVLDRRNHHLFQPLLYQVATAALSPADITQPIRTILKRQANTQVLLGEATAVDAAGRKVILADGDTLPYDFLVLACGAARHNYFGNDSWSALAPGLKSLEDAVSIRGRFLSAFEEAEREPDPARRRCLLTFVIIGGGPTGVELAGAMAEIARRSLPREFRHIDSREARIVLLEGGPRLLPSYAPALGDYARKQLAKLGVEVRTNTRATAIEPERVLIGEEVVEAHRVFWAAGVAASLLGESVGAAVDRGGRVLVEPDLSIPGHPEILVAGDMMALRDARGREVPGLAPAATQAGRYAGRLIRARLEGRKLPPFRYRDKGILAVVGRGAAVVDRGRLRLAGFIAWLIWLLVHIYFLIGFRNRLLVLVGWAWSYVGFHRGARLITEYSDSKPAPPNHRLSA